MAHGGSAIPGWMDPTLIDAMKACDADVCQQTQWWKGKNNGMSKCWVMQDGMAPQNTRYSITDGAPWNFVFLCKESSVPQGALDVTYLFSPHSMTNLRGAVVPTKTLVPRIDTTTDSRRWRVVGIWKKRDVDRAGRDDSRNDDGGQNPSLRGGGGGENSSDSDSEDDGEAGRHNRVMQNLRGGRGGLGGGLGGGGVGRGLASQNIHDMDLHAPMPGLDGDASGTDLENVAPVRIEERMVKVLHYDRDADVTGDQTVHHTVFCVVTITPLRNVNLAEYLRHTIIENVHGVVYPGMSQVASEEMRRDRRNMLHRILLEQMDMCGAFAAADRPQPDPLDVLNMPSADYYPGNYLSVPMVYSRIQVRQTWAPTRVFLGNNSPKRTQYTMHKRGYNHKRIYVEGFSDTVSLCMVPDLRHVKDYNNTWAESFYQSVCEFEGLKPEERVDFVAQLRDACPPSWPRDGERDINDILRRRERGGGGGGGRLEDDDEDDDMEGRGGGSGANSNDELYVQKNRMPPVKICLRYNPLMYISPSATRAEWEQQLGSFPAFFIYSLSRMIYSSASNPLLKPEYFMPKAKPMSNNMRWHEYMNSGDNPLAGFCAAGAWHESFGRATRTP
jgi:hypothetical protein